MSELKGHCLCEGITFRTTGEVRDVLNCHCHRCRRFTGHYMTATSSPTQGQVIEDPDDLLTWYGVDGASGAHWTSEASDCHQKIAVPERTTK